MPESGTKFSAPSAEYLEHRVLTLEEVAKYPEPFATRYLRGAFSPLKLRQVYMALQYDDHSTIPQHMIEPKLLDLMKSWFSHGKPRNISLIDFRKSL